MRVHVLTYHSNNVLGHDYDQNDHVALAEDLRLLHRLGLPVLPLRRCVDVLQGRAEAPAERAVAISFDDGSWFDWHSLEHPTLGRQPGFRRVLLDSPQRAHGTAFVIASPQARAQLDQRGLAGLGWWDDSWWPEAARSGLIDIENHSWDHNHEILDATVVRSCPPGRFDALADFDEAEAEIVQAREYLDRVCAPQCSRLFAYPYGHVSDYLARDYLPRQRARHGLDAAFSTEPRPLQPGDDPWTYGRYVCGWHWRSPGELERLLV